MRYLLEMGLDVHHVGKWGGALHRATASKCLDCVNTVLEYGADVNQTGGELHVPLQRAAYLGDVGLVELFCNHGADIHAVGGKYHTALQAAVVSDSVETVQWLLNRGADPNENGGEYGSALHAAIHAEEPIPLINLLLEHGADINAVDERGTPLQLAAAISAVEVVTLLLDNGARHEIVFGKYGTALQAACLMTEYPTIAELIEREADPFLPGGYYNNAFIAAAANGMQYYVQDWLPRVPEPWMLVEALHYAIHFREKGVAEVLLDHGVGINVRSSLYGSAMKALEAGINDTERKQKEGDWDFWYHDNGDDEDKDSDDEDDGESQNAEPDDNEADDSGYSSEEDDNADEKAEAEAEAEIKAMLEKLLETNPQGQNQDCQPEHFHYTVIKRKPLASEENTGPIPAAHPMAYAPPQVTTQQEVSQVPDATQVGHNMHTSHQAGFGVGGNFNYREYNGNYQHQHQQQNDSNPWGLSSNSSMHSGRRKFGFRNALKNIIDQV